MTNIITKMDHNFEKKNIRTKHSLFFREIGFFKIRRMKREFSGTTTGRLRTNSLRISQYINISIYLYGCALLHHILSLIREKNELFFSDVKFREIT